MKIIRQKNTEDNRFEISYGYEVHNQCNTCVRRDGSKLTCTAFPESIPAEIFMGAYDHTNPYNRLGMNDHGLTWVSKEE